MSKTIELISKSKKIYTRCNYINSDEVVLKAGFQWNKSDHPERVFAKEPDIQKLLKKVEQSSCTAGSDTYFCCTDDVICSSIEYPDGGKMDAQSVAASIIYGKRMNGDIAWVLEKDGKTSLRSVLEDLRPVEQHFTQESEEEIHRIMDIVYNQFQDHKTLEKILGYAHHLHLKLGGENQFKFEVPHHVDWAMEFFGFVCIEKDYVDLILKSAQYGRVINLSSKMGIGLIQTNYGKYHKSRGSKINKTKDIIMSNKRGSSNSNIYIKPTFDVLVVFQHTPFLACGVVPYSSLTIRPTKGGSVCKGISIDLIRWVIHPQEQIVARQLTPEENKIIDDEVDRCHSPKMIKRLLELPL